MIRALLSRDAALSSLDRSPCQTGQLNVAGLPRQTAILFISLFGLALFLYLTLWPQAPVVAGDSRGYLFVASDMKDGRIDSLNYRPPGYPLLLLFSGSDEMSPVRALFVLSLVLHFTSIWILAGVLHAAGLSRTALGLFAALLLLPPYVEPAAYVLTENFAAFMLAAGFGGVIFWHRDARKPWLLLAAVAVGYAGLIRPTYQALSVAIAGVLVSMPYLCGWSARMRRRAATAGVALIAGSLLFVGGYSYLNYAKFQHFGLSLTVPFDSATLSTRTARFVERLPDEYGRVREVLVRARDADLLRRGSQHTGYGYLSADGVAQELTELTGLEGPALARYMLRLNLLLIREAPLEYLYDVSRAFGAYCFPNATTLANMDSRVLQMLWAGLQFGIIGMFLVSLLMLAGGLPYWAAYAGVAPFGTDSRPRVLPISSLQAFTYIIAGTIVFYTALLSCFFETGDPRYRAPTDGLIMAMLFLGLHVYWRSIASAKQIGESARAPVQSPVAGEAA